MEGPQIIFVGLKKLGGVVAGEGGERAGCLNSWFHGS